MILPLVRCSPACRRNSILAKQCDCNCCNRILSTYLSSLFSISVANRLRAPIRAPAEFFPSQCFLRSVPLAVFPSQCSPRIVLSAVWRWLYSERHLFRQLRSRCFVIFFFTFLFRLSIAQGYKFLGAPTLGLLGTAACSFHFDIIDCTNLTGTLSCIRNVL